MLVAILLLLAQICVVGLSAQIRTGISKENARHLWYASLINDFGIGYVEWQYGELAVHRHGHSVPLYLELTKEEWQSEGASSWRDGSPLPGADHPLGRSGRSRRFRYAAGSTLSFYRLWHAVNTSLESQRPEHHHIRGQTSWADVRWTVSPGMIQDTMEVALCLVDARTGRKLALLDSVGVLGSAGDVIARRYGTEPDRALRRIDLPDRFAGREVVVQPLPYRYGPTPFGLLFMKRFSTYNLSALFERESEESFPGPLPRSEDYRFSKKIDSAYGHDLREHYAQAYMADSCPPALMCLYALDPGHQVSLNAFLASMRFRRNDPECRHRAAADTSWWVSTLENSEPHSGAQFAHNAPNHMRFVEPLDVPSSSCMALLQLDSPARCCAHLIPEYCWPVSRVWRAIPPLSDEAMTFSAVLLQPVPPTGTRSDQRGHHEPGR